MAPVDKDESDGSEEPFKSIKGEHEGEPFAKKPLGAPMIDEWGNKLDDSIQAKELN